MGHGKRGRLVPMACRYLCCLRVPLRCSSDSSEFLNFADTANATPGMERDEPPPVGRAPAVVRPGGSTRLDLHALATPSLLHCHSAATMTSRPWSRPPPSCAPLHRALMLMRLVPCHAIPPVPSLQARARAWAFGPRQLTRSASILAVEVPR